MAMIDYLADMPSSVPESVPSTDASPGDDTASDDAKASSSSPAAPEAGEEPSVETAADELVTDEPEPEPEAPWTLDTVPDRTVRVKVDGQECELSLKECVQRGIATATLHRRMEQLATRRKEMDARESKVETFFGRLTQDPDFTEAWLERYAPQVLEEVAERRIQRHIQEQKLSPEQRSAKQVAEERARLEAERRAFEEERQRNTESQATQQAREQLQPMLTRAAQANGLPMGREFVTLMRLQLEPVFAQDRMPTQADIDAAAAEIAKWRGVTPQPVAPAEPAKKPPVVPPQAMKDVAVKPAPKARSQAKATESTDDFFRQLRRSY